MNLKLIPILILLLSSSYAVAQVQPMPSVEIPTFVGPRGIHNEQLEFRSSTNQFYDFRKTVILTNESSANEDKYPLTIRFGNLNVNVLGATVVGVQSESLTWDMMKSGFDGDAVRIEVNGFKSVDSCYFFNVQDGFSPRGEGGWSYTNCWQKNTRDDAIENDALKSGITQNCLYDGVFMFLSARPGDNTVIPDNYIDPTVRIYDCLIRIKAMPDDNPKTRFTDGNGNAHGQFFKWSSHGGTVDVKNTIFRIDQYASRGSSPMGFPAGTYQNCVLVWLGEGDYPAPIPEGMFVTTDKAYWTDNRKEWVIENSWRFPNRNLLNDLMDD